MAHSLDQPAICREVRMIAIEQLRYVRLGTKDLAAATNFAQRILGLELVEQDDTGRLGF
jgi:catechol-2,3-dioxygenase